MFPMGETGGHVLWISQTWLCGFGISRFPAQFSDKPNQVSVSPKSHTCMSHIFWYYICLVAWNIFLFFPYTVLGMSSSQLTFIFFRWVAQPPTSISISYPICFMEYVSTFFIFPFIYIYIQLQKKIIDFAPSVWRKLGEDSIGPRRALVLPIDWPSCWAATLCRMPQWIMDRAITGSRSISNEGQRKKHWIMVNFIGVYRFTTIFRLFVICFWTFPHL